MSQPVLVSSILKLRECGVQQTNFGFSNTTLQSEKYVCVREQLPDNSQRIAIVDIANPSNLTRHSIKADSALMNPIKKIIALKADKTLQVFDLEAKSKVAAYNTNDVVKFWKWVDNDLIAFVSENKLFHWNVRDNSSAPKPMFGLTPTMQNALLLNYQVDHTRTWCALIGANNVNNKIVGVIQLSKPGSGADSQMIEGNAAVFTRYQLENEAEPTSFFIFVNKNDTSNRLAIIDLAQRHPKKYIDLGMQPHIEGDFPLAIHTDGKSSLFYVITKCGVVHMCEMDTSKRIFATKVGEANFFTSVNITDFGFIALSNDGNLVKVCLDKSNFMSYCRSFASQNPMNAAVGAAAMRVVEMCGLPGSEEIYHNKFNMMLAQQQYEAAAKYAANSPNKVLRNPQILSKLQSIQTLPGQTSPMLQYFGVLLESGQLTAFESVELCKPVVMQGKKNLVEKWLNENKLECSDELGDIVKRIDPNLALSIYLRSNSHERVMQLFAETGQFDKIVIYAQKVGSTPNYVNILGEIVRSNPDASVKFTKQLLNENPPLIDIDSVINVYMSFNMAQHCTNALLDTLKVNLPEHRDIQTKLLEMDIIQCPQVADAILGNKVFTQYDPTHIAQLCEKAGLIQRALENFSDIYDIKRCIIHTRAVSPDWLVEFFGTLSIEDSLECFKVLLGSNPMENMKVCVAVATKYSEQLTVSALISLFESYDQFNGLFLFLGGIVNFNQDPEVHFKYIQAACKIGQISEAERICRESNIYDSEKVKNFLKTLDLDDPRPLIIVCDKNNYVSELISYLYKNKKYNRFLTIYVQKVNPTRLPIVVANLLDSGCELEFLREMIMNTPDNYDMVELVDELKKRNSMKLLNPLLEKRIMNGSTDVATHTAMAIIRVDNGNNPQQFLRENNYYDYEKVGRYCEKIDASLSAIAYTKGGHDQLMIDACSKHKLFVQLGEYLVSKKSDELWAQVLDESSTYRRPLIDSLVQNVLPATTDPEGISIAVKAFMQADIPHELTALLSRLIFGNSLFSSHRNLQNLLLLTSIKAEKERVMDYINKLDNFDASDIASVAKENGMLDEAFAIYKKFNLCVPALDVLVRGLKRFDKAKDYAEQVNKPEVWSVLAKAQLGENMLKESIDSYLKAKDISNYREVVAVAKNNKEYSSLKVYLELAMDSLNDSFIDNNYACCLVYLGELDTMERFVRSSSQINLVEVGDTCFERGFYEAAKILFQQASNYPKLAVVYVKLDDYNMAVECAKKSNNLKTWKEVCFAAVDSSQFSLAEVCGLYLIVNPEDLLELSQYYQDKGHFNELMTLLENGVGIERANRSIFTELAIVYAKYRPKKLKEHLDLFWSKINISSVLLTAEQYHMWPEVVFLYEKFKEYDNALSTMINHPINSYQESYLRDIALKVASNELLYRTAEFYFEQHPLKLGDFLILVSSKIDPNRIVETFKLKNHLPLIKNYLEFMQKSSDNKIVNETLNQIYIDEYDYKSLSESVGKFKNFDMVLLADKLENHELIEYRRIANQIYTKCNRWQKSIELAQKDGLDADAIKYACESRDPSYVKKLLEYFTSKRMPEHAVRLTYDCNDLLKADDVLECFWKNDMMNYTVPYFIQLLSDVIPKVENICDKMPKKQKEQIKEQPSLLMNQGIPMITGGSGSMQSLNNFNQFGNGSSYGVGSYSSNGSRGY